MNSSEPDFEQCVRSIQMQKNVLIKHIVINNLPEMDAHNEVYGAFNQADSSMIRAKIDADVVLMDESVLTSVANMFRKHPHVDWIDPLTHDFMSDSEIKAGLAFYRSNVKFNQQTNPLWCDRNIMMSQHLMIDMQCIGKHMHFCNEVTAFRYGLHRGLKGQVSTLKQVKKAHLLHGDKFRALAIKGFELASQYSDWHEKGINLPRIFNYDDEKFTELFQSALTSL